MEEIKPVNIKKLKEGKNDFKVPVGKPRVENIVNTDKRRQPVEKTLFEKYTYFKWILLISGVFILISSIVGGIMIVWKVNFMSADKTLVSLIYVMGTGWMILLPIIPILFIARREIWNKLKIFGRKSRVIILRIVGGDSNEHEVILKLEGNNMTVGESKLIINPRKATLKDGVKVLTYVADNALAHDFFIDQKQTLKQLGEKLKGKTDDDYHDIFSDPIRVDAKYYNETFLAAQQTNPDILNKIIAFLTSKNVIGILLIIAAASAGAAVLGLQANNMLNDIPFCKMGTITP